MHATRISFDGDAYVLDPDSDLLSLMERVETASRGESTFVTFSALHEQMSVLITSGTRVVVTVDRGDEVEAARLPDDWSDGAP